jgi:RND family efflux transporter MFP subunit
MLKLFKQYMKKSFSHYFTKKYLIIGIPVIAVIIIVLFTLFRNSNSSFETAYSELGTISEKVSVTGKVIAFKKALLGFENGGVVSKINYAVGETVKTGDSIIVLDSSDAYAGLQGAEASLRAEQSKLTELQNGLRPEELSVEDSKFTSAKISFEDSRTTLINALHDSYVKTENSITNYSDIFFLNAQTTVPKIILRTDSYTQENNINNSRVIVGEKLKVWKNYLDGMTLSTDPVVYTEKVHGYLETTKTFLSQLSSIVSSLTTGNSGLSQGTIDSYNSTMNLALSTFNTAVGTLASAEATYRTASSSLLLAKDQFNLKKVGSSAETIEAQRARVEQARANVLSSRAVLQKKSLVSPIDGVVTKIEPELGEFVGAGVVSAIVMSDLFKIEVNIPESDIAKINIGNTASVTLDAYDGSTIFSAHVISIDPAETIVQGVPTYKVTLQFDEKDSRVRSGMTANIDIITNTKVDVVTVPFRAVVEKNGEKFVKVVKNGNSSKYEETKVITGIRGNDGKIEIVSGINSGVKVITLIK